MSEVADGNISCAAGAAWPAADACEQVVLATSAVALIGTGLRALRRNKPAWVTGWVAALAAWGTLPKYFICTRCENYGKPCDFFYGGEYAALLFKKQDKPFNAAGYFAEGISLGIFLSLPAIAARRDPAALSLYALAGAVFQASLVKICCIDCVNNARDTWKADYCPTYKIIARMRPPSNLTS